MKCCSVLYLSLRIACNCFSNSENVLFSIISIYKYFYCLIILEINSNYIIESLFYGFLRSILNALSLIPLAWILNDYWSIFLVPFRTLICQNNRLKFAFRLTLKLIFGQQIWSFIGKFFLRGGRTYGCGIRLDLS